MTRGCARSACDVDRVRLCDSLRADRRSFDADFLLLLAPASSLHWNGLQDNGIGGISMAAGDARGEELLSPFQLLPPSKDL